MPLSSIPQMSTISLRIDRPFAFYIINRLNRNTLFSGHVYNVNPATTTQQAKKNVNPLNILTNNSKRPVSQTNEQVIYKYDKN